jgi:hypothetical protein
LMRSKFRHLDARGIEGQLRAAIRARDVLERDRMAA